MSYAVDSVFDIAFWFADRALNENEYLQPLKLQYLLYLSQSYYAIASNGKRLFPAIFVAGEEGPIEPSLNRAWSKGRPNFDGIEKLNVLTCDKPKDVDAIITNPPFFAINEILDRALFEWKIPILLLCRIEPLSTKIRNHYTIIMPEIT